jgi:hypothetical protein
MLLSLITALSLAHEVVLPLRPAGDGAAQLENLFWAVSTPGNPEYLKFRCVCWCVRTQSPFGLAVRSSALTPNFAAIQGSLINDDLREP